MNTILKTIVASILLCQITETSIAQTSKENSANIKTTMDSLLYSKENGLRYDTTITGAAIGVYWKGKTHLYTLGQADKKHNIPVDTNTLFEIGSNTKVFTGLMLSSEMADGKISGDHFIDKYVSVNKGIQNKVRITDLANHISGLPTFHDSASLAELMAQDTSKDPLMLVTDQYMLSVLKKVDTLHQYGSYEYSNFAVGILGYILQQKEHKTYNQLLQEMICKPMKLTSTTAIADTNNKRVAKGYYRGVRSPFIHLCSAMQGAGAIQSDIADMMTFIKYQIHGNPQLDAALTISHKKYYNGDDLQIAMGWHLGKEYETEIYEMRGDTYGASSAMLFSKDEDLGIVILLNAANSRAVHRIKNTILSKLLDKTGGQNKFAMAEITVDKKTLDSYAGVYELQPGFDATVTNENGKLGIQLTGQPKLTFKAVASNWFVLEKYNCQLEFLGKANEPCQEFVLYQNGQKINCKRK